jgi:hypothetical protein
MKKLPIKKSDIRPEHIEEDLLGLNKVIDLLEKTDLTNKSIQSILNVANKLEKEISKKYELDKEDLDSKK